MRNLSTSKLIQVLSVLSLKACKRAKINTKQLLRSNGRSVSYSGHAVETCGKVQTTVRHKDQYFGIADCWWWCSTCTWSEVQPRLKLVASRVYSEQKPRYWKCQKLINEYDHLFKGMGCLPGKYDIKVYPTVPPVIASPRRIPHT